MSERVTPEQLRMIAGSRVVVEKIPTLSDMLERAASTIAALEAELAEANKRAELLAATVVALQAEHEECP